MQESTKAEFVYIHSYITQSKYTHNFLYNRVFVTLLCFILSVHSKVNFSNVPFFIPESPGIIEVHRFVIVKIIECKKVFILTLTKYEIIICFYWVRVSFKHLRETSHIETMTAPPCHFSSITLWYSQHKPVFISTNFQKV